MNRAVKGRFTRRRVLAFGRDGRLLGWQFWDANIRLGITHYMRGLVSICKEQAQQYKESAEIRVARSLTCLNAAGIVLCFQN